MTKNPETVHTHDPPIGVRHDSTQPPDSSYAERFFSRGTPNRPVNRHRWRNFWRRTGAVTVLTVGVSGLVQHMAEAEATTTPQDQRTPSIVLDNVLQTQTQTHDSVTSGSALSPSLLPGKVKITRTIVVHPGASGWTLAEKEAKAADLPTTTPIINALVHELNGKNKDGVSDLEPAQKIEAFSNPVNEALGEIMETPLPKDTPEPIKKVKDKLEKTRHYKEGTTFKQTEAADEELVADTENLIAEAENEASSVDEALQELGIDTAAFSAQPDGSVTQEPFKGGPSITGSEEQRPQDSVPAASNSQPTPPSSSSYTAPPTLPPAAENQIKQEIKQVARQAGTQGFKKGTQLEATGALVVGGALTTNGIVLTRRRRHRKEQIRREQETEKLNKERELRDLIDNARYSAYFLIQAQEKGNVKVTETDEPTLEAAIETQMRHFDATHHDKPLTQSEKMVFTAVKRRLYDLQAANGFGRGNITKLIALTELADERLRKVIDDNPAALQAAIMGLTDPNILAADPYIQRANNQEAIDKLLRHIGIFITRQEHPRPTSSKTPPPRNEARSTPPPPGEPGPQASAPSQTSTDAPHRRRTPREWFSYQWKRVKQSLRIRRKTPSGKLP